MTKTFPGGVVANDSVNFEIKAGEIHSLLGENGAGKTTLMNILYGLYKPDKGEIYVRGEKANIKSPEDAQKLGIGMVHQHRNLIPAHSVIENIVLGHPKNEKVINMERAKREVRELAEKYDFDVDLDAKVWQLDAGEAQIVEILKVLYQGAKIIIMDEPSSALAPQETEELMDSLKKMSQKDLAVVPFITHKLPIAIEISDRITVLRNGKVINTVDAADITEKELAEMMVGREVLFDLERPEVEIGDEILQVQNLSALDDQNTKAVNNLSFSIRKGEIFGIVGVAGNGQTELVETLMGLRNPTSGKIIFDGEDITGRSIRKRWEKGIGYIPADRNTLGSIGDFSLQDNIAMNLHWKRDYCRRGMLMDHDKIREHADKTCKEFDVKAPNIDTQARQLSGGNLQKLITGRVFSIEPRLLIAHLPTRGLDVGAAEFVAEKLLEARKKMGILLVSESIDQTLTLSDRIAPMYDGEFVDILSREEATKSKVGAMMAGLQDG
ncbi:hypothetical protein AKJ38_01840 [candidate division MSBL1 archaeon SCGC-AAA259I14]|uniref:ABC transporter domain-containing protein n=2 Tax=candidate division MSBL1 TaxID=215777 RepID=A0A133USF6_9EURY|nr:hypothetical protein AKJ66_01385 [candidate division MSBL1 archaeon SCGC-AAA259E22]KXA97161.1 hypothetical protein AKJ38_01840 [candidate division MSBL1 archaeon SCGC-AAA259I14]